MISIRSAFALATLALAAPASASSLQRAVEDALAASVLDGASYGLVVWDADGGTRVSIDPERRLIPASTAKWITAAAAAEVLSLDFRFETNIAATGYIEGGTLHGDLVVVGSGDPSLGDPDPQRMIADVIQVLHDARIRAIDGDLVVDASLFDGPPYGPGWMWDDFVHPYSPPYTAANVGHNLQKNGIGCASHNGPGSPIVDPPACLADVLRAGLVLSEIAVSGTPAVRSVPEAVPIGTIQSPPLRELLHKMLAESDNLYAECISHLLAARASEGQPSPTVAVLASAGVAPAEVSLVDGSGLSRYSFATAAGMVRLSSWVEGRPWGAELTSLLPVSGRSGTLGGRMLGTPAEGRVQAKTGSMSGVRNMVGFVETTTGERLRFAFLINGIAASQSEAIAVQDRVLALIAASDGRRVKRSVAAALGSSR